MKTTTTRSSLLIAGGTAIVIAAFILRGLIPEAVRYLRIRRM
jgi:hypothetical protein